MARDATSSFDPGKKRKRNDQTSQASKKRCTAAVVLPPERVDFQDRALQLEAKIHESRTNYNSIQTLLECLHREDGLAEDKVITAVALCRVFCRLLAGGSLSKLDGSPRNEATIIEWLRQRLQDFEKNLMQMLIDQNINLQCTALTVIVRLVKEKASHLDQSEDAVWRRGLFGQLIETLIQADVAGETRAEFTEKYVGAYDDIRYYTFACLAGLASNKHPEALVQNTLTILAAIGPVVEQQKEGKRFYIRPPSTPKHNLYSLAAHRRQAQRAWLALLCHDLSKGQRKAILELMSHRIAPWFLKVEHLMDFLTDSFNVGGSTSLLSLSGLFYLIQHKNLDYPQFYQKLYSLLDPNTLHSKHRSRFFRLLNTFLASTHLPAALVASFVKRLARLSLFAPPSGIVVVVPWIYNLLKSHPSCTFMIHRIGGVEHDEGLLEDPFRPEEPDPMETDALESSLWEIEMLQSHYHPNVATIARMISEQFTKQAYDLEDFLDHSYGSMLDAELSKNIKKPPEIEYEIPTRIFSKQDTASAKEDSLLAKLWSFT